MYKFNPLTWKFDLVTDISAKADLVDWKVPVEQLPSYVDDVIEVANFAALPLTWEQGKIYVTLDDNKNYRWSGSTYILLNPADLSNYYNKNDIDILANSKVSKIESIDNMIPSFDWTTWELKNSWIYTNDDWYIWIGVQTPISPLTIWYNPNFIIDIANAWTPVATPSETWWSIWPWTYYYVIIAQNTLGSTVKSSESIGATIIGSTWSIGISWNAVPWAISYSVYRTTISWTYANPALVIYATTNTTYIDTLSTPMSWIPPSTDTQWSAPNKQFISWSSDDWIAKFPTVSIIEKILANTADSNNINITQQILMKVPLWYPYRIGEQVWQRISMINCGSWVNNYQTAQNIYNKFNWTNAVAPIMYGINLKNEFSWTGTGTASEMVWFSGSSYNDSYWTVNSLYWTRFTVWTGANSTSKNTTAWLFQASVNSTWKNINWITWISGLASMQWLWSTSSIVKWGIFSAEVWSYSGWANATTHIWIEAKALVGKTWISTNVNWWQFYITNLWQITGSWYWVLWKFDNSSTGIVDIMVWWRFQAVSQSGSNQNKMYWIQSLAFHGGLTNLTRWTWLSADFTTTDWNVLDAFWLETNVIQSWAGVITNAYWVYINTINWTNKWWVYQVQADVTNFFWGKLRFANLQQFEDNATAMAGWLISGDLYKTSTWNVKIVY